MPSDEEILPAVNVQQMQTAREQGVPLSIKILDKKKILGQGRYGTVFEGTWQNEKVAVKRIQLVNIDINDNTEENALKTLDHPNVIKLYHVESDEDFKYFALEYCQASLDQLFCDEDKMKKKKYREKMPSEKEVFLQLAKGLEYIHQMGLTHRDLKPPNVLIHVDSTGEKITIKWADFGLSKPVNERGSCSMSGTEKGTNNWYAPEILEMQNKENEGGSRATSLRHRGTVKSDVFTEGLIFGYYLLNGRHPFGSNFQIAFNILHNNAVNLNKIILQPPQPIHDVIMEMLKSDPVERISSSDVVSRITNIK